MESVDLVVAV